MDIQKTSGGTLPLLPQRASYITRAFRVRRSLFVAMTTGRALAADAMAPRLCLFALPCAGKKGALRGCPRSHNEIPTSLNGADHRRGTIFTLNIFLWKQESEKHRRCLWRQWRVPTVKLCDPIL